MIQIITKRDKNPTKEFSGIWWNAKSGGLFVWTGKPVLIGHSKDGQVVRADVFKADFVFEEKKNLQKYKYEFDYHGLPMLVIAKVEKKDFDGTALTIDIGGSYGEVEQEGVVLVMQRANVVLGEKLRLFCTPTKGSLSAEITILSYE